MKKKIFAVIISVFSLTAVTYAAMDAIHNWNCKKCGTVLQTSKRPSNTGCPANTFHQWYDLGEVGEHNFQCKNCGITVKSAKRPAFQGCPSASFHNWNQFD